MGLMLLDVDPCRRRGWRRRGAHYDRGPPGGRASGRRHQRRCIRNPKIPITTTVGNDRPVHATVVVVVTRLRSDMGTTRRVVDHADHLTVGRCHR